MYKETFKTVNGDIIIEDGDIALTDGVDELRQNLEHRYSFNKGEWFLDIDMGLDYKEIVGKGVPDSQVNVTIRECGFQDDRVTRVDNIDTIREKRKAHIRFDITDEEDNVIQEEVDL